MVSLVDYKQIVFFYNKRNNNFYKRMLDIWRTFNVNYSTEGRLLKNISYYPILEQKIFVYTEPLIYCKVIVDIHIIQRLIKRRKSYNWFSPNVLSADFATSINIFQSIILTDIWHNDCLIYLKTKLLTKTYNYLILRVIEPE